jgi:hypothetical protein
LEVGENSKANLQEIFVPLISAQHHWRKSKHVTGKGETLRSYIQRWSIIKNSAEDVSDERAIDAFSEGLHWSDLVEEIGRTRPTTVAELMEQANKFADGEDAYNNKRG